MGLLRFLGWCLILFGVADFLLSLNGIDPWSAWFGIELPEPLYHFSPFIEGILGGILTRIGSGQTVSASALAADIVTDISKDALKHGGIPIESTEAIPTPDDKDA